MSLINDVLRDLERRDAPERPVPPHAGARKPNASPTRSWRWSLWLIAALALGGVLHLSLRESAPPTPNREPTPLTAQVDSAKSPESTAAPVAEPPTAAPETATPEQNAASDPASELTPPEPEAEERVAATDTARRTNAQEDPTPKRPTEEQAPSGPDPVSATEPAQQPEPSQSSQSEDEQPRISIRRSGGDSEATDPLVTAKRFLARGQFRRAESRLKQLVEQQPGRTEAHELLADTLIRQRRQAAAIRALESGLADADDPAALAAKLGRLLIEGGAPGRARRVLETHAPALAEAPDYHLLLSAAHRQSGDHAAAAAHYRKLTEIAPLRGAAWIGLGASLESLDRPDEAIDAYNRALNADDARAARFARQRLTALEPMTGEEP